MKQRHFKRGQVVADEYGQTLGRVVGFYFRRDRADRPTTTQWLRISISRREAWPFGTIPAACRKYRYWISVMDVYPITRAARVASK